MKKEYLKLAVSLLFIMTMTVACSHESPEEISGNETQDIEKKIPQQASETEADNNDSLPVALAPRTPHFGLVSGSPSTHPRVVAAPAGNNHLVARHPTLPTRRATAVPNGGSSPVAITPTLSANFVRQPVINPSLLGQIDNFRLEEKHRQYVEFIYGTGLSDEENQSHLHEIAQNYSVRKDPSTGELNSKTLFEFTLISDAQLKEIYHRAQSQITASRGTLLHAFENRDRAKVNEGIDQILSLTSSCAQMKARIQEAANIYGLYGEIYQEPDYFALRTPLIGAVINLQILEALPEVFRDEYRDILFNTFEDLLKATTFKFTGEGGSNFVSFYDFANSQLGFFDANQVGFFK